MSRLHEICHQLCRKALLISAAGLILMTLIISWQVFARYVLNASPSWSESIAQLLMLYYILLAAAVGVHENFHLGINLLADNLPDGLAKLIRIVSHVLVFVFGAAMIHGGVSLAMYTVDHLIPALGISRSWAYWPFAATGVLICLFAVEKILLLLQEETPQANTHGNANPDNPRLSTEREDRS